MAETEELASGRIRVGISACLLGEKVRFDGGHKEDRFITGTLSRYFEWVRVCPEVELGLATPRPTMQLVALEQGVGLRVTKTGEDLTGPMRAFSQARAAALEKEDLRGYILKSDSPSCGLFRVRVYSASGMPARNGRGLFAEALQRHFPELPIEEEGRLCDPRLRENWVERVFAYERLRALWSSRWTVRHLIDFHTAHKLVLLAHSPVAYKNLGELVARSAGVARERLKREYGTAFMAALAHIATRGRHANVLQHMAGYFKKQLDAGSRSELQSLIEDYRSGTVPLVVPLTLLRHYVRRFEEPYLAGQVYLNPHPKELALRSYI